MGREGHFDMEWRGVAGVGIQPLAFWPSTRDRGPKTPRSRLDAVTPVLTLGTLYSSGVGPGINKTKQHQGDSEPPHSSPSKFLESFIQVGSGRGIKRPRNPF